MKRRLLALLSTLTVMLGMFMAGPLPVAATGDCARADLIVWSGTFSGSLRRFCYGVNDADIEGETSQTIMGPLDDGTYKNDFDSSSTQSGVLSARYGDNGGDERVCLYQGKNYTGNVQALSGTSSSITFSPLLTPGSIHFYTANFCPAG